MTQDTRNLCKFFGNSGKFSRILVKLPGFFGSFQEFRTVLEEFMEVFEEFREASDIQGTFVTYFLCFSTSGESFACIFNVSRRPGTVLHVFSTFFCNQGQFFIYFGRL